MKEQISVILYNIKIEQVSDSKYLGVTSDNKHVNYVATKKLHRK